MKEIILIMGICGLFIFFLYFLIRINKKTKVKEVKKEEKLPQEKKEDIPEIIKEVTMGNYMFDMSQNDVVDGVEMPEDNSIEKKTEVKDFQQVIEDDFDRIENIGSDFGDEIDIEVEEIVDEIDEIDDFMSEIDEINYEESDGNEVSENKVDKNSTVNQIKGLSKEIKTILIANILEKKHKD